MTLKLTLDYTEFAEEYCGSVFYFDSWEELLTLVKVISNNSYHTYFIEEYDEKVEKNNEKIEEKWKIVLYFIAVFLRQLRI